MAGKAKYFEIKELIEDRIRRGIYPLGEKLPAESELVAIFNASRGTIRQALQELESEGMIARRSGIGTIVVRQAKTGFVASFTEQVKSRGMTPSTRLLSADEIMANEANGRICEAFLLDEERAAQTPVFRIDRLRYADGQAVARQTLYLRASEFEADLLQHEDFTGSIFTLYARHYRHIAWADEIIQARLAAPDEVELFGLSTLPRDQQIVYTRDRISYDQQNLALEVMTSVERGDFFGRYRYRIVGQG